MDRLAIWGVSDQGRILESYIHELGLNKRVGMFNPEKVSELRKSAEFKQLEDFTSNLKTYDEFIVGVGGILGFTRFSIAVRLQELGLSPFSFFHKTAFIDPTTKLSPGAQVMPCATIGKFVSIGEQSIVNTSATIDHDSVIGNGVHIMGSAALAGRVTVRDFASIGTNATILPRVTIGLGCVIGAGAVVTKSTDDMGIYVGVPARKIGETEFQLDMSMLV